MSGPESASGTAQGLAQAPARVGHRDGSIDDSKRRQDRPLSEAETSRLRGGVGTVLRHARERADLSARTLARGAGAAHTTVVRVEGGQRRPRPALLAAFARVLRPDDPDGLMSELVSAAGPDIAPDTVASLRQRANHQRRANIGRARHAVAAQRAKDAWLWNGTHTLGALKMPPARLHYTPEQLAEELAALACFEAVLNDSHRFQRLEAYHWHCYDRWPRPPSRWPLHWRLRDTRHVEPMDPPAASAYEVPAPHGTATTPRPQASRTPRDQRRHHDPMSTNQQALRPERWSP